MTEQEVKDRVVLALPLRYWFAAKMRPAFVNQVVHEAIKQFPVEPQQQDSYMVVELEQRVQNRVGVVGAIWTALLVALIVELVKFWFLSEESKQIIRGLQVAA